MKKEEIYRTCLAKCGIESQMERAEEQCLELALAIKHFKTFKAVRDSDRNYVITEVADMVITCQLLGLYFGEHIVCDKMNELLGMRINRLIDTGKISPEEGETMKKTIAL